MAVSKEAQEEYKEGQNDSKKGAIEQASIDIPVNHPDTSAYYKGREGEELDEDKGEDKDDKKDDDKKEE